MIFHHHITLATQTTHRNGTPNPVQLHRPHRLAFCPTRYRTLSLHHLGMPRLINRLLVRARRVEHTSFGVGVSRYNVEGPC
jgi:hypothetical protein